MRRLLTLGGLDLRSDDDAPVEALLGRPKRLALLLYLALREPPGFQQRTTLCALLWPESDDARARNSLRNALHHLRAALGPDAIAIRGDDEVGIDARGLWCDAVAFERAVAGGRYGEALQLWRGPLLPGFLPPELPELCDWLDERRRALQRQAADAARALAGRARAARNWPAAVTAARRWVEIAPHDEEAIRALLHALAETGQHGEAIAAFDGWRARFTRDLEVAPTTATLDAAARLRDRATGAAPREAASHATATPPAPALDAPPAAEDRPSLARPRRVTAALLTAAAVLALAALAFRRDATPRPTRSSSSSVAVLPFSYGGSPELHYLREGMVDLLSTRLGGIPGLRAVDPRSILARVDRVVPRDAAIDPERGREIAGAFGAPCFVLGSVVELRGRLSMSAAVYETAAPDEPLAQTAMSGDVAQVFALADSASDRLARACATASRVEARAAAIGAAGDTRSVDALREFVRGEIAFNAARYDDAVAAYRRATELDSGYARAYVHLSLAANWVGEGRLLPQAIAAAERHAEHLSADDRTLLRAWRAHIYADPSRAESLYTAYLRTHPDNAEAWIQLGEVRLHWGSAIGVPAGEARDAFARALALLPEHAATLTHLVRLAGRLDSAAAVRPLVLRLLALGPREQERQEARAILALAERDTAALGEVARAVTASSPESWKWMIPLLSASTPDPGAVRELRRYLGLAVVPERIRAQLVIAETMADAAAGRFREARARSDEVPPSLGVVGVELRALLAALPIAPPDARRVAALRDSVRALPAAAVAADPLLAGDRAPFLALRRPLLDALLSLRLGDTAAAARSAGVLESLGAGRAAGGTAPPDTAAGRLLARDYAALLRARLALARGQSAASLAALGAPHAEAFDRLPSSMSYGQALARLTRAEALRASGRDEEALRWYGTFPDNTGYDVPFVAPVQLAMAALHARRGRAAEARRMYDRALRIWRDADPELQPQVRAARAALDSLDSLARRQASR